MPYETKNKPYGPEVLDVIKPHLKKVSEAPKLDALLEKAAEYRRYDYDKSEPPQSPEHNLNQDLRYEIKVLKEELQIPYKAMSNANTHSAALFLVQNPAIINLQMWLDSFRTPENRKNRCWRYKPRLFAFGTAQIKNLIEPGNESSRRSNPTPFPDVRTLALPADDGLVPF